MTIKEIKARLSMEDLINYYGIKGLRKSNNRLSGACPIHKGDNPNAFHLSLDKNLWNCFTRNHGGDVISFIMQYENVDFKRALEIAENILRIYGKREKKNLAKSEVNKSNPHLKFKLKLEPEHRYLEQRGLKEDTIRYFEIGFCKEGYFKNRIVIPIYDEQARLVAYAGRSINDEMPKYKFPKGFNKSLVVFNLHRVKNLRTKNIIVVEGFFDCFKVWQAGFKNVVALMGCSMSKEQMNLLVQLKKKLILMLDGDCAGRNGTRKIVSALKFKIPLTIIYLPLGTQPDSLPEEKLKSLLGKIGS